MALLARSSASSVRPARSSGVRSLARPVSKVRGALDCDRDRLRGLWLPLGDNKTHRDLAL